MEAYQRDTGANWKGTQWPKLEQSEQWNQGVSDYNLVYKKQILNSSADGRDYGLLVWVLSTAPTPPQGGFPALHL